MSSPVTSRSTRPLKRSASAASLPTPPRTNRRQKNRKLRSLKAVTEEERGVDAVTSSDEEGRTETTHKRRRISSIREPHEDDEETFWMAGPSTSQKGKAKESSAVESDSDSDTTTSFLSRRGQQSSTVGSAPVSPPPSHRRIPAAKIASVAPALKLLPVVEENPSSSCTSPPETPKSSKMSPSRDSPNNPFLASPLDLDTAASACFVSIDLPTFLDVRFAHTSLFFSRGVKKTYPNPYYDHENDRPRSPEPNSLLPPEHEDYTPDLRGAPRALWPRKKKAASPAAESPSNRSRRRKAPLRSAPFLSQSDDELDDKTDDGEEVSLRPVRLFGPGGRHPGDIARS
ncbi:hypothetical protein J3R30DRAFT_3509508 [Lentinula aciculospora]|uniref:Uncharacterized protein n=1 Tax=Lentinula aciculospora TaxID=153920 RepID=A0A9W9A631_9AGAR|nr:hypothetical protein J3R30DRAFT_3509508 [Lentinula aciculospora]